MSNIRQLIGKLRDWGEARDALRELSALPPATKRADVYPKVIEVAVEYWCEKEGPSGCGYEIERIVEFLIRELDTAPGLMTQLCEAMPKPPIHRLYHFYNLVRAARDPVTVPHLRDLWRKHTSGWGDAACAVDDFALADAALAALQGQPGYSDLDFATAAAWYAGKRAIDPLHKLFKSKDGYRKDGFALGLALAGDDDEAFFKALSTKGEGGSAKKIFAATHKSKQKDRLAAIDGLAKGIETGRGYLCPATLLFACRLLEDADPMIVERAAKLLADYPVPHGDDRSRVHHAAFLRHARAAVERGVSASTRKLLDQVVAAIPHAPSLGEGPSAPAPALEVDSRKAAADARARATLDAMGVAAPATKGSKAKAGKAATAGKTVKGAKDVAPKGKPLSASLGAIAGAAAALRDQLPAKHTGPRNAELEAAILEEPSDRARYLVYGDWLQQQGDPRGALVALHDAIERGDKSANDAAALLLVEQRHALLGLLDGVKHIELDWDLGFIRHAAIAYASDDQVARDLDTLLEADSARFLRSLAIAAPPHRQALDTEAIVERLLERAPKTLSQLQLGKPGQFTITPELLAAFPRLQRDPTALWAEVTEALAGETKLKSEIDAKKLPKLMPQVKGVEADAAAILRGLKAEIDKKRPIGVLAALPQVFTRDSVDQFAHAIAQQWLKLDSAGSKWAFEALGPLGGDVTAAFLGAHLHDWSHQRAVQACEQLRRIGSDFAITEIAGLVLRPAGAHPRRNEARNLLEDLASQRGIAYETLLIRACPVTFPDEEATVARFNATQRTWLLHAMIDGLRISAGEFRRHVAEHPHRRAFAASLVWGQYDGRDLEATFAVARDGSLRRADGSPYELSDHPIGVIHPVELAPADLEAWRDTFHRREISQCIPQLDRPFFTLTDDERRLDSLKGFAARRVGFYAIRDALEARDWVGVNDSDGGGIDWYERTFPRDNAVVDANFNETRGSIGNVRVQVGGRGQSFTNMHRVTISELLYDLEVAHGFRERTAPRGGDQPASNDRASGERRAPAQPAGPGPIVERAKTGRSKCVVCTNAIAKGEPRVGVERMIKTDTFTGRGTVWAHPACREGMPELEGVALDALIAAL